MKFLEVLHRRLSRPVLPSDETLAYLPTQAVAAYVTNVLGLDGIIYSSTQVGAEGESTGEQLPQRLCNIALFGPAALVERTPPPPRPPDPQPFDDLTFPVIGFPGFAARHKQREPGDGGAGNNSGTGNASGPGSAPSTTEDAAGASPMPRGATTTILAPDGLAGDGREATLRVRRDPSLERIRALKVETSGMFAHLYEDGRIIINDDDEEDND